MQFRQKTRQNGKKNTLRVNILGGREDRCGSVVSAGPGIPRGCARAWISAWLPLCRQAAMPPAKKEEDCGKMFDISGFA